MKGVKIADKTKNVTNAENSNKRKSRNFEI